MTSGGGERPWGSEFEPTSLIQYIQLAPERTDKKVSRWAKLEGILSRIIRSRFGLRSAELADRYAEAKVAAEEGKARIRNAEAMERVARASKDFAKAKRIASTSGASRGTTDRPAGLLEVQARVEAAIAELSAALAALEDKGGKAEIRLVDLSSDRASPEAPPSNGGSLGSHT